MTYVATYANRVLFFHDGAIVDSYQNRQNEEDLDCILMKFKEITRGIANVYDEQYCPQAFRAAWANV